jgi:hypothetical protein
MSGAVEWRLVGEEITSCNCAWGCPCQFSALPTSGQCEAIISVSVQDGHYGDTPMAGVRFSRVLWWPGAVHQGGGTRQLIIDASASQDQWQAIERLESDVDSHPFFGIYGSMAPTRLDTLSAPIEFELDREGRRGRVGIGKIAEVQVEPIRNPVTGLEHRARIDLPNGFEYNLAEIGNTVSAVIDLAAPLNLRLDNSYAQLWRRSSGVACRPDRPHCSYRSTTSGWRTCAPSGSRCASRSARRCRSRSQHWSSVTFTSSNRRASDSLAWPCDSSVHSACSSATRRSIC